MSANGTQQRIHPDLTVPQTAFSGTSFNAKSVLLFPGPAGGDALLFYQVLDG